MPHTDADLVAELRDRLIERLTAELAHARSKGQPLGTDQERQRARDLLVDLLQQRAREDTMAGRPPLDADKEARVVGEVLALVCGMGSQLEALLRDPNVENIDANGADCVWVEYADGTVKQGPPIADNDAELEELIRGLAIEGGGLTRRAFDTANPLVTVRLADGSRLNATMAVSRRPCIAIRRHRLTDVTLDSLVELGTLTTALRDFLRDLVAARCNIMIGGATNSGKTTLLRAMLAELAPQERLFVIERSAELDLERHPHRHANVVSLQERLPNLEGHGGVPMSALVQQSLGMHPSRVIVGEVLGPEIMVMLHAMTQGNNGSLSTVHARDNRQVITRLRSYASRADERPEPHVVDELIAGGLDFLIFLENQQVHGQRRRMVTCISEVSGVKEPALSDVFVSTGPHPAERTDVPLAKVPTPLSATPRRRPQAAWA